MDFLNILFIFYYIFFVGDKNFLIGVCYFIIVINIVIATE